jgi:hypothetical protein
MRTARHAKWIDLKRELRNATPIYDDKLFCVREGTANANKINSVCPGPDNCIAQYIAQHIIRNFSLCGEFKLSSGLSDARREADAYPFIVADGKPYGRTLHIGACGTNDLSTVARVTSTGQGASRMTRSATLPKTKCSNPVRPCVAITIKSTSSSRAARTISMSGTPVLTSITYCTPALRVFLATSASLVLASFSQRGSASKGSGTSISWVGTLAMCSMWSVALLSFANAPAKSNAAVEFPSKSNADNILVYFNIAPLQAIAARIPTALDLSLCQPPPW